jgi:hypothetical protein
MLTYMSASSGERFVSKPIQCHVFEMSSGWLKAAFYLCGACIQAKGWQFDSSRHRVNGRFWRGDAVEELRAITR